MFDAVVFAGGGNRCYWQGRFYQTAAPRLGLPPKLVVGASAGAFAASYSLLGVGPDARRRVFDGCGPHLKNFDIASWRRGEPLCPVGPLYRELLDQTVDDDALRRLNAITDLQIAVTRLPRAACRRWREPSSASAHISWRSIFCIPCIPALAAHWAFVPNSSRRKASPMPRRCVTC